MLVLGLIVGAAAFWFIDQSRDSDSAETEVVEVATTLVEAEERDLLSFLEWSGVLESGTASSVSASARGTVTRNSSVGDPIELGQAIAEIDGTPVIALYGSVPQFRVIDINAENGADIAQLERNLVALGYDPDGLVTVDDDFTSETAFMVERWEIDLGFELPDGTVDAGQIAFISGPSEVTSRTAVGSQIAQGQPLLSIVTQAESGFTVVDGDAAPTGSTSLAIADESVSVETGRPTGLWELSQSRITLEIDVGDTGLLPVGQAVDVELPDGETIAATVAEISDVARQVQDGQNQVTVLDVTVEPNEPIESAFSAGPVTILAEDNPRLGATVIPVRALVALADGGHAVEREDGGLVGVELGAFDEGWVEITNGALEPGDSIVAPA